MGQVFDVNIPELITDASFGALRSSMRPLEYKSEDGVLGGHYRMSFGYSSTAAKPAGGSDIMSLRWADSRFLFVLMRLELWIVTTTPYTASLNQDAALYRATGFSVAASAGTQIQPVAAGLQRMRPSQMADPLLASGGGLLWVSSGDLLTVGTRTLDTQPMGYGAWLNAITPPNLPSMVTLFEAWPEKGEHPLILGPNEGLVVQTPIGNGQAAGVSKFTFVMQWALVPVY